MNLLKQILIQVAGAIAGIAIILAPKLPYTVWSDAILTFGAMYLWTAAPLILITSIFSSQLNPKQVKHAENKETKEHSNS